MKQKFELQEEYIRQSNLILAGLIGISVVIVQALISTRATDIPAVIAILAFAIALPMMGTLVMLNAVLARFHYASFPGYITLAYFTGEGSAAVGVVAAFWHLSWVAGVLIMASCLAGLGIYFAYSRQLQKDNAPDQTAFEPPNHTEPPEGK